MSELRQQIIEAARDEFLDNCQELVEAGIIPKGLCCYHCEPHCCGIYSLMVIDEHRFSVCVGVVDWLKENIPNIEIKH